MARKRSLSDQEQDLRSILTSAKKSKAAPQFSSSNVTKPRLVQEVGADQPTASNASTYDRSGDCSHSSGTPRFPASCAPRPIAYSEYQSRAVTVPFSTSPSHISRSLRNGYQDVTCSTDQTDLRHVLNRSRVEINKRQRFGENSNRKRPIHREEEELNRKRPKRSFSPFTYEDKRSPHLQRLQFLCTRSSSDIISRMRLHEFTDILSSLKANFNESVHLLVRVLCRLSMDQRESTLQKVNRYYASLLQPENMHFLQCISVHLCSMPLGGLPTERMKFLEFLADVINLFGTILKNLPADAPLYLPIDACCGAVEQLASQDIRFQEINDKAQKLKSERDRIRNMSYETSQAKHKNLGDRTCLPTPEDLLCPHLPSTLQENVIKGPYPSPTEYLAIHFNLLREDFINPLRCALHSVQNEDEHNLSVFEDVRFKSCCNLSPLSANVTYELSFKTSSKIMWERSKKLTYGSLLCLSEDNFKQFIFASVEEREIEALEKGIITVKLQGIAADDPSCVSSSKVYRMLESPCYYEAFAPVLRRLNGMNPKQIPFQKYVVKCETDVDPPIYLRDGNMKMNLCSVICNCNQDECKLECIDIGNEMEWLAVETQDLDTSQKRALHTALTNEVALIQGPPGTGKTFIGLKILQALLLNRSLWKQSSSERMPIVILCYTNHALDQFLEGLIKIKVNCQALSSINIRRLGGRCKSQVVDAYNLKKFINKACRAQLIPFNSKQSYINLKKRLQLLEGFLEGKFESNRETIAAYSSFITDSILFELEDACHIVITLPNDHTLTEWLDHWHLFRQVDQQHHSDSLHHQFEDDRRVDEDFTPIFESRSLSTFVKRFRRVEQLTERRAERYLESKGSTDLEGLPRLQLFKYCLLKLKDALHKDAQVSAEDLAKIEEKRELIKLKCLLDADVIGLTTTAAAKYNVALSHVKSKITVIEEAAEVLESQIIASLTKHTQHLILIGDHKQLPPKTNDYTIARRYKLGVSLFERLVKNQFPFVTLEVQHRMNPEISAVVSKTIYNGILKDSESTKDYKEVTGMKCNVYFVDHSQYETPESDNSPSNEHEAEFIICLCRYLIQNGYKHEEITVITPYVGQMFRIRTGLKSKGKSKGTTLGEIRVSTIDNYQGEENEIILLSLVRSNKENKAGFVKEDNRICVAMSRAKVGFYCVGNFSLLQKASKLWKSIIDDLKASERVGESLPLQCVTHKEITEVTCARDFDKVSDGGCEQRCNIRLPDCNHVCQSKCHPNESKHREPCSLPCPKLCKEKRHRCKSECGKICGDCKELVEKVIPKCSHKQKVPCHLTPERFVCEEDCLNELSCGHPCKLKCGEDCQSKPCKWLVKRKWPCGHEAQKECHIDKLAYSSICSFPCGTSLACGHTCKGKCGRCRQGRLHIPCKERCGRSLFCGHFCSDSCANNCPPCRQRCQFKCPHAPCGNKCSTPCDPCPHRCEWKCEHYQCTKNCGEICDRPRCSQPCQKKLKCGHMCIGLCGEPCPSICRKCDKDSDTFTIFFGPEDEEDSCFINLVDCDHLFEVTSLDEWVDSKESDVIKWKACPKCSTPIFRTPRYADVAKGILKHINVIKRKEHYRLTQDERGKFKRMFTELPHEICTKLDLDSVKLLPTRIERILASPMKLKLEAGFSKEGKLPEDIPLQSMVSLFLSISESLDTIADVNKSFLNGPEQVQKLKILRSQVIDDFLEWIIDFCWKRVILTDQMQIDLQTETRRIILLRYFYQLKYKMTYNWCKLSDLDSKFLEDEIQCYECLGNKPQAPKLTEKVFDALTTRIRDISRHYQVSLSREERYMIIRAIDAKPGSWYTCENGHYYQIGQCGGAMETSRCPECSAKIGGRNHRLTEGNKHADDFDDSRHAAWSEGANMENYELN